MKACSFRQWGLIMVGAALLSVLLPLGVCWCVECPCKNNNTHEQRAGESPCACEETQDKRTRHDEMPTPCSCCDIPENSATIPKMMVLTKKTSVGPSWFVSSNPVGSVHVSGWHSKLEPRQGLFHFPVPLYLLLCVFLN